jgi:hypothetical protein
MKKLYLLLAICLNIAGIAKAQSIDEIYNAFKNNQYNFPPPPNPRDTIYVGEWDASASDPNMSFIGIKGGIVEPHGTIRTVTHLPGIGYSFSFKYTLKFRVKNLRTTSLYYVKVNGVSYQSIPNQADIYVDVQNNTDFNWQINAGANSYADKLHISRIPVVVAGVFKVPLMPLLVLYEPPPNRDSTNNAKFDRISQFQSSFSISVTNDQSTTTSKAQITSVDYYKGYLGLQGATLSHIPDPRAQIAGKILTALTADVLWGGLSSTITNGTIKENEMTISNSSWNYFDISTKKNQGGPGKGDIIRGLRNCRFLWVINDGHFSATMLDYENIFQYTDLDLKDSLIHSSNKSIYLAISKTDPFFTYGPTLDLRSFPNRYEYQKESSGDISGDAENGYGVLHRYSQTDRNTSVDYSIDVEDYRKGLLSYLGLSPYNATETVKTTIQNKVSNLESIGYQTEATLSIGSDQGEHKFYDIFVDKIYGTFAVQDPTVAVTHVIPGVPVKTVTPTVKYAKPIIYNISK